MRKLLQACSKALKRSIETAHLVAQFRGLFVPGRSPILLASGQIGHLLIDGTGQRIKLLARGRSGKEGGKDSGLCRKADVGKEAPIRSNVTAGCAPPRSVGVLEPAAMLEVNRNAGCTPGVTSHRRLQFLRCVTGPIRTAIL
jgi:hypothetical protein